MSLTHGARFINAAMIGVMVTNTIFHPTYPTALTIIGLVILELGGSVVDYFDRRGQRVENETKAEVQMTSEALTLLTKRLDELEPRVQRIDNRTRRAGET